MLRGLIAALGALLIAGCASSPAPVAEAPPRVNLQSAPAPDVHYMAVVGDSYTAGSLAGGKKSSPANWVNRIKDANQAAGVDLRPVVGAIGGAGYAANGHQGSGVFADQVHRVVGANDDLVVIFGSRNDSQIAPEKLAVDVRKTLASVKQLAPRARILMVGPVWPNPTPTLAVQGNRDVLAAAAKEFGATFIDPVGDHWFWDRPDLIGPDLVHPTDDGHGYMADRIAPVVRQLLG